MMTILPKDFATYRHKNNDCLFVSLYFWCVQNTCNLVGAQEKVVSTISS